MFYYISKKIYELESTKKGGFFMSTNGVNSFGIQKPKNIQANEKDVNAQSGRSKADVLNSLFERFKTTIKDVQAEPNHNTLESLLKNLVNEADIDKNNFLNEKEINYLDSKVADAINEIKDKDIGSKDADTINEIKEIKDNGIDKKV